MAEPTSTVDAVAVPNAAVAQTLMARAAIRNAHPPDMVCAPRQTVAPGTANTSPNAMATGISIPSSQRARMAGMMAGATSISSSAGAGGKFPQTLAMLRSALRCGRGFSEISDRVRRKYALAKTMPPSTASRIPPTSMRCRLASDATAPVNAGPGPESCLEAVCSSARPHASRWCSSREFDGSGIVRASV